MTGRPGYKKCFRCKQIKPSLANFRRYPNGKLSDTCDDCRGSSSPWRTCEPMGIPPVCDDWLRYKLAAPYRAVRVIE